MIMYYKKLRFFGELLRYRKVKRRLEILCRNLKINKSLCCKVRYKNRKLEIFVVRYVLKKLEVLKTKIWNIQRVLSFLGNIKKL